MSYKLEWNGAALKKRVRNAAKKSIDETTAAAVAIAQVHAPRDTGFMANTIEAEPAVEQQGSVVGRFGNFTASYTLWNEIGTSRMPARPFLRPAAATEFPKLGERMARNLK